MRDHHFHLLSRRRQLLPNQLEPQDQGNSGENKEEARKGKYFYIFL